MLSRALKKGSWPEAQEAILRIRGLEPGSAAAAAAEAADRAAP